ncbi:sensor histidine kinase [Parapedobacter koreensis]|nr:HAMP domain-containing sensor histidine kinase [Parapedobacter koreensis]
MKLVNKFTLWFVGILILTTPISMTISQYHIRKKIDEAEVERLSHVNDLVASQLKQGIPHEKYAQGRPIHVSKITGPLPDERIQVKEENYFNEDLQREECQLTVTSYYEIGGSNYLIASHDYVIKARQVLAGMMSGVIWKMILVICCVALTAHIVSGYTLKPFYQTLKTIQSFSLTQKNKLDFPQTSIKEFQELNTLLQKMTEKIGEDYASLKEFSENASHELQTPLAVIRSKLDLLANTPIHADQAQLIAEMQHSVEKLSRINRSLLLLTKLENHEFDPAEHIRLCRLTTSTLSAYQELIQLKSLTVQKQVNKDVYVRLHPTLAEILLNNLLHNAIRHNIQKGQIEVSLTSEKLVVRNTGTPPKTPTDELFLRFKKNNQSSDGIGLGLAIVKQICEISGFDVGYRYADGWHCLSVIFDPNKVQVRKTEVFADA